MAGMQRRCLANIVAVSVILQAAVLGGSHYDR